MPSVLLAGQRAGCRSVQRGHDCSRQISANKKAAPSGRPPCVSTGGLSRRVARSVLRIAGRVVGSALCLIHLALGLHLLVTRNLAGRVLDGALDLVGGTFDVFAIHDRLLSKSVVV